MTSATLQRPAFVPAARPASAAAPRRSLFLRFMDAIAQANQRRADREIAEYIRRNGGALNDRLERGIERSFL